MKVAVLNIKKQLSKSLKDFEDEVWKDIPEYEGLYQVSNYARVKRLELVLTGKNRWKVCTKVLPARIHKYHLNYNGRPRIELSKGGIQKIFSVSRLVGVAFVPNPLNLPNVCHHDDNPVNNFPNNLFWGTHKDNIDDKVRKNRQAKGERNGKAFLTANDVLRIRKKYNPEKYNTVKLASEYNTTTANISLILKRRNWKHI